MIDLFEHTPYVANFLKMITPLYKDKKNACKRVKADWSYQIDMSFLEEEKNLPVHEILEWINDLL